MKTYKASAKGDSINASTPREAARRFFDAFPSRRKCSVSEGVVDGVIFSMRLGGPNSDRYWRDVTRGGINALPDEAAP